MAEPKINDNQTLLRLIGVVLLILFIVWIFDRNHPASNSTATPGSTDTSGVQLMVNPNSNSSTANPQQTTNPGQSSNDQVQSGQSNLQPAQGSTQMPADIKQELGL